MKVKQITSEGPNFRRRQSMNVTKQKYKGRKLHKEGCLQKVAAEQQEHARVPDTVRIAENNDINTYLLDYYKKVCAN